MYFKMKYSQFNIINKYKIKHTVWSLQHKILKSIEKKQQIKVRNFQRLLIKSLSLKLQVFLIRSETLNFDTLLKTNKSYFKSETLLDSVRSIELNVNFAKIETPYNFFDLNAKPFKNVFFDEVKNNNEKKIQNTPLTLTFLNTNLKKGNKKTIFWSNVGLFSKSFSEKIELNKNLNKKVILDLFNYLNLKKMQKKITNNKTLLLNIFNQKKTIFQNIDVLTSPIIGLNQMNIKNNIKRKKFTMNKFIKDKVINDDFILSKIPNKHNMNFNLRFKVTNKSNFNHNINQLGLNYKIKNKIVKNFLFANINSNNKNEIINLIQIKKNILQKFLILIYYFNNDFSSNKKSLLVPRSLITYDLNFLFFTKIKKTPFNLIVFKEIKNNQIKKTTKKIVLKKLTISEHNYCLPIIQSTYNLQGFFSQFLRNKSIVNFACFENIINCLINKYKIIQTVDLELWNKAILPIIQTTSDFSGYNQLFFCTNSDLHTNLQLIFKKSTPKFNWVLKFEIKGFLEHLNKKWLKTNLPFENRFFVLFLQNNLIKLNNKFNKTPTYISNLEKDNILVNYPNNKLIQLKPNKINDNLIMNSFIDVFNLKKLVNKNIINLNRRFKLNENKITKKVFILNEIQQNNNMFNEVKQKITNSLMCYSLNGLEKFILKYSLKNFNLIKTLKIFNKNYDEYSTSMKINDVLNFELVQNLKLKSHLSDLFRSITTNPTYFLNNKKQILGPRNTKKVLFIKKYKLQIKNPINQLSKNFELKKPKTIILNKLLQTKQIYVCYQKFLRVSEFKTELSANPLLFLNEHDFLLTNILHFNLTTDKMFPFFWCVKQIKISPQLSSKQIFFMQKMYNFLQTDLFKTDFLQGGFYNRKKQKFLNFDKKKLTMEDIKFNNLNIISYYNKILITGQNRRELKQFQSFFLKFLIYRGLYVSLNKTKIVHIRHGFDFVGFNYKKNSFNILVNQISLSNIRLHQLNIKSIIKNAGNLPLPILITKLNQQIRNWILSNIHLNSLKLNNTLFLNQNNLLNLFLYRLLWKWAKKRHNKRSNEWIFKKYWCWLNSKPIFFTKDLQRNYFIIRYEYKNLQLYRLSNEFTNFGFNIQNKQKLLKMKLSETNQKLNKIIALTSKKKNKQ